MRVVPFWRQISPLLIAIVKNFGGREVGKCQVKVQASRYTEFEKSPVKVILEEHS